MGIYNFYQVPKVSRLPHLISYSRAVYLGLVLGFFSVAFLRTAWVTEDAYITFRVIDNLNAGYGLVWNLGERVQVFTHPLWLFLLSPVVAVLHDPFWASLLVSYALLVCVLCLPFFTFSINLASAVLSPLYLAATSLYAGPNTFASTL